MKGDAKLRFDAARPGPATVKYETVFQVPENRLPPPRTEFSSVAIVLPRTIQIKPTINFLLTAKFNSHSGYRLSGVMARAFHLFFLNVLKKRNGFFFPPLTYEFLPGGWWFPPPFSDFFSVRSLDREESR